MKNKLIKYYIAAFCFCSTSIVFAQPGTEDTGGTGNLESPDAPAAPIDDYVGVLALVGMSLVFIKVKVNQNSEDAQFHQKL